MSSPFSRRPVFSLGLFRQLAALFAVAVLGGSAYATINAALQMQTGNPSLATADTSNHSHFLIQRPQYAMDYNDTTHQPNWVAWDLTSGDVGGSGRSDFIVDTTLPSGFYQVLTTDYSGSGYDRGHMCPSADRTVTVADNQQLFYMSNMVPQSPDNNQGVWASFETYCRSLASAGNEILIISGPSGFGGSTIVSGVAIPGFTWKVAVVVPLGGGTALSRIDANTRVIAIKIPNVAGVRNNPWQGYTLKARSLENELGYDFFRAVETRDGNTLIADHLRDEADGQVVTGAPSVDSPPVAQSASVGGTATFNVIASGDAPLAYQWLKDDDEIAGATGTSLTLTNIQASDVAIYSVTVSNNVGSVTSNGAALVVAGLPPTIATQPVSRTEAAGSTVSFAVVAGGSAPFTYQWSKGGVALTDGGNTSGSATPTLTLSNVQNADAANYSVVVQNNVGTITSDVVSLGVTAAAPTITSQPANRSLAPGSTANFTVVAVGTAPLSYQWRKGGSAISTATNPSAGTATLTLTGISLADAANYDVVVSNGIGAPATSAAASLSISSATASQIFYTGGTYVQEFDTLPVSGTFTVSGTGANQPVFLSAAPINASGLGGWSFAQILASGGTTRFTIGTNTTNTGSAYSYGTTTTPVDRALGVLNSGSNASVIGAVIVNNTGQTISSVSLAYTGEQWRWGGAAGDKLSTEYRLGGSDVVTGPFTAIPALDFNSPIQGGTAGGLDGNAAANRRALSTTLGSITWLPGQTLVIRWKGFRASTADGLAVDSFSLGTTIAGPVGPSVASTSPADGATGAALNTPIAITFDQAVTASGSSFTISSATRGALSAAVSASADSKTYTLTLPANFNFSEAISVNVLASGVASQSTGLHPAANYSFSFTTTAAIAPSIATQPSPQTATAGGTASFTVGANGTAPFTFQWRKNGAAIVGNPTAALATLVLNNVQAADIASYDVVVSNGIGSPVTSTTASLSVTPTAPSITTQPIAQIVAQGASVSFTVAAKGTEPLTYQWRKGGSAIVSNATATSATLLLTNVQGADIASYDVVVSNGVGSPVTSSAVSLTVLVPPSTINFAGGTYAQDFDTLPNAGTFTFAGAGPFSLDAPAPVGVGASGAVGWSIAKAVGSQANVLFRFDDGTNNAGNLASYGTAGATDRALGSLASGTFAGRLGVTFVNTTGHTIDFVTVNYTGEQWRYAGSTVVNKLTFSYSVGASDLGTGTFTNAAALDFTAPIATGLTNKLDGNLAANRVPNITTTLTGLNWAPGQTLVLRWTDADDTGSDSALAIDDFSLTDAPPVPVIATQPVAQTVPAFTPASFTVAATSTTALTYQWQKNGVDIVGNASATTPTLTLASATAADVATYDCVVTNAFGSTTSNAAALSIIKVPAAIALDATVPVYDGTPKAASATTSPAGLAVGFTYNGDTTVPTNAGTYAVTATIVDANYSGSIDGTFTIAPAVATVALGSLNTIYNGTPQAATATTVPASLPVAFTYDTNATAPTNAGGYAVVATVTDPNYSGSATGTLTIAKAGAGVVLSNLSQVYNGAGHAATVATTPAGLAVAVTYNTVSTLPINAGSYAVVAMVNDANYFGAASGTLVIAKAAATVALSNTTQTYDGAPKPVTLTTTPAGLAASATYDTSATAPTNAGTYAVAANITDPNYSGSTTGSLTIDKAVAPVVIANLHQTFDGTPKSVTTLTTPAGLTVNVTYNSSPVAPSAAGSYAVVASISNANYRGSSSATLVIGQATATIALSDLTQVYDGTPKSVTTTTTPTGLAVSVTYNASATAPTNPGSYAVVATITDPNYSATTSGTLVITSTALVRHAPSLDGGLDGSLQVLTGESLTLNGNAWVSGDILVPGTPTVRLNGHPTFAGTQDGTGSTTPSNYQVTLNGNAVLRHLVRRTDPIAMPVVAAPAAPTGTRNVSLNNAGDSAGDFATIRNLTLNGNAGTRTVPAGVYGSITVNGNSGLMLGVAGSTTPAVYQLQSLTLNGNAQIQIAGPVVIVLANGVSLNGNVGAAAHPEWLTLNVASGGVTLNGNVTFNGSVVAPNGTVVINGNTTLNGSVVADRLTLNGNSVLNQP